MRTARLAHFALISGTGWCLDLGIMTALAATGMPVFFANCISAATAVSFVFAVAQRRTFVHDGAWIGGKFALYGLYNAVAILLASLAIAALAHGVVEPILQTLPLPDMLLQERNRLVAAASVVAKMAITPLTLYANFLFMGWLLEGRASLR